MTMSQLSSLSCKCHRINSLSKSFPICNKLDESLRHDIKLIHVFGNNNNVLFVTTDDRVFGFGYNESGVLGLSHNERVEQPIEVIELRDKRIKEIFTDGEDFVEAISEDIRVFTWGHNNWGQLGRDCETDEDVYHKPYAIDLSLSEDIVQVCCRRSHTLVLTSSGLVYGWGRNEFGEIGLSPQEVTKMSVPVLLKTLEGFGIKRIGIGNYCNFAVTIDGWIITWARDGGQPADDWQPLVITVYRDVVDICETVDTTYMLTNEGIVNIRRSVFFARHSLPHFLPLTYQNRHFSEHPLIRSMESRRRTDQTNSKQGDHHINFKEVRAINEVFAALSEDRVYTINKNDGKLTIRTNYKTFFDFFVENKKFMNTAMIHSITKNSSCLFNDDQTSDFKIKIRGIDGNYDHIYCHKSLLTEKSEYFERMFAINWSESNDNEMEVIGHSLEAFYHYIRWLYTDCIATQDIELLIQMLSISDQYLDNKFKDKILKQLKAQTNVENVCSLYGLSIKLNFKAFQDICWQIITENIEKVIETEDFDSLDAELTKHLFREYIRKQGFVELYAQRLTEGNIVIKTG